MSYGEIGLPRSSSVPIIVFPQKDSFFVRAKSSLTSFFSNQQKSEDDSAVMPYIESPTRSPSPSLTVHVSSDEDTINLTNPELSSLNVIENKIDEEFSTLSQNILNSINDIRKELDSLTVNEKTGYPLNIKKMKNIINMVEAFEPTVNSFTQKSSSLKEKIKETEIFYKTVGAIFELNHILFQKMAFHLKIYPYKIVNIYQKLLDGNLLQYIPQELKIDIKLQYTRDLLYKFHRKEVKNANVLGIAKNLREIKLFLSKIDMPNKSFSIRVINKMIVDINKNFLLPEFIEIEFNTVVDSLKDTIIDVYKEYVDNILDKLTRNAINEKECLGICKNLSKIILNLSDNCFLNRENNISLIVDLILKINKEFFLKKEIKKADLSINISVDVSPLMSPEKIKKFALEKHIPVIIQSDVAHFFYNKKNELEMKIRNEENVDAADLYQTAEEYITKFVENIGVLSENNAIQNLMVLHLVLLSIYGSIFDSRDLEVDQVEEYVKGIFEKYEFIIQKVEHIISKVKTIRLNIDVNFLGHLYKILYASIKDKFDFKTLDLLRVLTKEQIEKLKEFFHFLEEEKRIFLEKGSLETHEFRFTTTSLIAQHDGSVKLRIFSQDGSGDIGRYIYFDQEENPALYVMEQGFKAKKVEDENILIAVAAASSHIQQNGQSRFILVKSTYFWPDYRRELFYFAEQLLKRRITINRRASSTPIAND